MPSDFRPLPAMNGTGWLRNSIRCAMSPPSEWPVVFGPSKDRPILFTAAAFGDVLLTLDRNDFGPLMGTGFYGLAVLTPGNFLRRERAAGRLLA